MRVSWVAIVPIAAVLLGWEPSAAVAQSSPAPKFPCHWGPEAPVPLLADPADWPVTGGVAPPFEPVAVAPASPADLTTIQILGGAYFNSNLGPKVSSFNYAPIDVRVGRWFSCPCLDGTAWRGNGEVLIDLLAAPVLTDYGTIVTGPSLLLRYNFVQPSCALMPYLQVGAGLLYTDASRDRSQKAIGEAVEFLLQAGLGCRYVLDPHWSVDVEGGFQHISNGGLAGRNYGANDFGVVIGLTYYFPKGCW